MFRVLSGTGNSYIQLTEICPALLCNDNSIPITSAGRSWPNIFFSQGNIGNTLGTAYFDEIATMLRTRVEAAGFVDVREYVDRAPVGNWHPGNLLRRQMANSGQDPRLNRIGRCMAQGWLGWLEAMRPVLEGVYGTPANVDNIIQQVRADYSRPDYHGYNLMYIVCPEVD